MLGPEYKELGGTSNAGYLADESQEKKRRKSSLAFADKIWDLEEGKNRRQRIFFLIQTFDLFQTKAIYFILIQRLLNEFILFAFESK